jgi:AraC-like DNA-binding protein
VLRGGIRYVLPLFAIRFNGYAVRFNDIQEAMEDDTSEEIVPTDDDMAITATDGKTAARFAELERRIEQWVADKGYTEKNVTAKMLVPLLYTNSRYLSAYINTGKGKTFNQWINELRVGEAQRLMCEYPELTIIEIARQTGFSDKSNFIRHFTAIVGIPPRIGGGKP